MTTQDPYRVGKELQRIHDAYPSVRALVGQSRPTQKQGGATPRRRPARETTVTEAAT